MRKTIQEPQANAAAAVPMVKSATSQTVHHGMRTTLIRMLLESFPAAVRAVQKMHVQHPVSQLVSRTRDSTNHWSRKGVLEAGSTRLGILRQLEILSTDAISLKEASTIRNFLALKEENTCLVLPRLHLLHLRRVLMSKLRFRQTQAYLRRNLAPSNKPRMLTRIPRSTCCQVLEICSRRCLIHGQPNLDSLVTTHHYFTVPGVDVGKPS